MPNATCVGTQTSKVPTRVTLLFISYTVFRVSYKATTHNLVHKDFSARSRVLTLALVRVSKTKSDISVLNTHNTSIGFKYKWTNPKIVWWLVSFIKKIDF